MSDAVAQVNKMRSVSGLSRFNKHNLVKVENFRGEPSDLDQIILVAWFILRDCDLLMWSTICLKSYYDIFLFHWCEVFLQRTKNVVIKFKKIQRVSNLSMCGESQSEPYQLDRITKIALKATVLTDHWPSPIKDEQVVNAATLYWHSGSDILYWSREISTPATGVHTNFTNWMDDESGMVTITPRLNNI